MIKQSDWKRAKLIYFSAYRTNGSFTAKEYLEVCTFAKKDKKFYEYLTKENRQ